MVLGGYPLLFLPSDLLLFHPCRLPPPAKMGAYSLRKEVTWMKITLYYCGETFDLEGGEAKALVKQLDNQEYPGLVTVKTSSGELTVNLTETTSFALHRRRSMRIM